MLDKKGWKEAWKFEVQKQGEYKRVTGGMRDQKDEMTDLVRHCEGLEGSIGCTGKELERGAIARDTQTRE